MGFIRFYSNNTDIFNKKFGISFLLLLLLFN